MIDLKNTNIILTGATGIIGNAILDKLILGGSNILASGTNEEKLKKIKAKYKNVNILRFDISDHKKIDGFIEDCNSILIEVSTGDVYKNGAKWDDIKDYLNKKNFKECWSPKEIHSSVLFVKY